jgi:hypothetical protein
MAWARLLNNLYYFAPAYMASVPAALWLLKSGHRRWLSLLVVPLTAYVVGTTLFESARQPNPIDTCSRKTQAFFGARLHGNDAALTSYYVADIAYIAAVRSYVIYIPPSKLFHALPPDPAWIEYAHSNKLVLRYYSGPTAIGVRSSERVSIGQLGTRMVRAVPGGAACGIVELARPIS